MSGRFGEIRDEIEALLRQDLPIIEEYRLEMVVPAEERGMFYPSTYVSEYNINAVEVDRITNVLLSYSVEVKNKERDVKASDRLIRIAEFVKDRINRYSRCGKLSKEITRITADIERGIDEARESDDYYVWTFVSFEMQYQDDLALRFEE